MERYGLCMEHTTHSLSTSPNSLFECTYLNETVPCRYNCRVEYCTVWLTWSHSLNNYINMWVRTCPVKWENNCFRFVYIRIQWSSTCAIRKSTLQSTQTQCKLFEFTAKGISSLFTIMLITQQMAIYII